MAFRSDEKVGLAAALVLHGALVAVLLMQAVRSEVTVFPDRMSVSLVPKVDLEAASPDPVSESRASIAPTLDANPAPAPEAAQPQPPTRVQPTPPKPSARTATSQTASTRDRSRPDRPPPKQAAATPPKTATKAGGGSRIGDDFLNGSGSSTTTQETRPPAAKFGSAERAALQSAVVRQLRPHWNAPSGADVEKLAAIVDWELNTDGSLKGRPRCKVDPKTITPGNQPQTSIYCERAIRAVQLAAPFKLPEQFYERWKALQWEFNRKL